MLESVQIKQVEALEELEQIRQLEQAICGEATPIYQLTAYMQNGGFILGAYIEAQLIGFNYSYAGFADEEYYLYSHLTAVARDYREQGVAELLKLYQKDIARAYGYKKCKWIIDPLEAIHGQGSFTKLRGYTSTYKKDVQGPLQESYNSKIPSDRLVVERLLNDDDIARWDAQIEELLEGAQELVEWSYTVDGLPMLNKQAPFDATLNYYSDAYLVPIPQYFSKIKIENLALAEDWRYKTRTIFETLFKQGYAIVHLVKGQEPMHFYLFVKKSLFAL
ncbi:GNAT family N-acetyltransferase [Metasolibacillus sp.]|uniref:GNAT family N-acetyltransferase n=1 Tax=Metasolibacillus sp. TaxID=2703680 RepID=UPI0025CEF0FE|nr:GNAT family N-acetyltransferase [Metasolibacillus sp.]MCT6925977.1 GNAT family N-acetyltransferase [Metasolibacillus sp.]MCT6942175.1 GNAT family N-acetyltransferase [Metasolibacillus sp.]